MQRIADLCNILARIVDLACNLVRILDCDFIVELLADSNLDKTIALTSISKFSDHPAIFLGEALFGCKGALLTFGSRLLISKASPFLFILVRSLKLKALLFISGASLFGVTLFYLITFVALRLLAPFFRPAMRQKNPDTE